MTYTVSFSILDRPFVTLEEFDEYSPALDAFHLVTLVAQIDEHKAAYKLEDSSGEVLRYVDLS